MVEGVVLAVAAARDPLTLAKLALVEVAGLSPTLPPHDASMPKARLKRTTLKSRLLRPETVPST
jgi:hypothetical protein